MYFQKYCSGYGMCRIYNFLQYRSLGLCCRQCQIKQAEGPGLNRALVSVVVLKFKISYINYKEDISIMPPPRRLPPLGRGLYGLLTNPALDTGSESNLKKYDIQFFMY